MNTAAIAKKLKDHEIAVVVMFVTKQRTFQMKMVVFNAHNADEVSKKLAKLCFGIADQISVFQTIKARESIERN